MTKIGLIAAAGSGSRLKLPFSKELYPIPSKGNFYSPTILHNILSMIEFGIIDFVIVINHKKSDIIEFLGDGSDYNVNISYVSQPISVSLPDAIDKAYHLIKGKKVFFFMGDTIIEGSELLREFEHRNDGSFQISLGCFKTNNPEKFGMVSHNNNIVTSIEDKNPSSEMKYMWGFAFWTEEFTEFFHLLISKSSNLNEEIFSDYLIELINRKQVYCVMLDEFIYYDLGTFDEIRNYLKKVLLR